MKKSIPGDPASQNAFVAVSLEFCIQNNFKVASRDDPVAQTIPPRLQISPTSSHHTETKQKIIQLALLGLDHYHSFLRVP